MPYDHALKTLKLGLIGDNIGQSKAHLLHRLAGEQNGVAVTYDKLIPREAGLDFDALFARCRDEGYRGLNITYPYKEKVFAKAKVGDKLLQAMGALNTIIFADDGRIHGYNTDYTGFVEAYQHFSASQAFAGKLDNVLMIGTGGVGRAVAFGLIKLGVKNLILIDNDVAKAKILANTIKSIVPDLPIVVGNEVNSITQNFDGVINCTPVGMVGYEGTPLPRRLMTGANWAFDAVYTPMHTKFLQDAQSEGLAILSGYELFFYQGVHAWQHFANLPLSELSLRQALLAQA